MAPCCMYVQGDGGGCSVRFLLPPQEKWNLQGGSCQQQVPRGVFTGVFTHSTKICTLPFPESRDLIHGLSSVCLAAHRDNRFENQLTSLRGLPRSERRCTCCPQMGGPGRLPFTGWWTDRPPGSVRSCELGLYWLFVEGDFQEGLGRWSKTSLLHLLFPVGIRMGVGGVVCWLLET